LWLLVVAVAEDHQAAEAEAAQGPADTVPRLVFQFYLVQHTQLQ
jgi:hypothetical protein